MLSRSKDALSYLHPSVELAFVIIAVVMIGLSTHIAFALIMLVWCISMNAVLNGPSSILRSLCLAVPAITVFAALNVLFYQGGSGELVDVGEFVFSPDALLYGVCAGCMLSSMILLLGLAGQVISGDGASSLISSSMPTVGLVLSMVLRLLPHLQRRAKDVRETASACTCANASLGKRHMGYKVYTTLMSWSMEDSIETASSMRARGWRRGIKRTFFNRRRFSRLDMLDMAIVVMSGALSIVLLSASLGVFSGRSIATGVMFVEMPHVVVPAVASCMLFLLLPLAYIVVKRMKWQHWSSRT